MTTTTHPDDAVVLDRNLRVRVRRRAGDDVLVLGLGESLVELDAIAAEVWTRLDGRSSLYAVAAAIAAEYGADVTDVCADVRHLVTPLVRDGFLHRAERPDRPDLRAVRAVRTG
jgi:pyrroloquinoline quinone biosynthesis protein D